MMWDQGRLNDRRIPYKAAGHSNGPPSENPAHLEHLTPAEERRRIELRIEEWGRAFDPDGPFEEWLVGQIATDTVAYDQCRVRESALRERSTKRAREDWESARRYLAERLGERLAKNPSGATRRLQETVQGVDWLLDRWLPLLDRLESDGRWSGREYALALDMMGIPRELRDEGFPALSPDQRETLISVVRAEIDRLRATREDVLVPRDAEDRELARRGVLLLNEDEVRRARGDRERCRARWLWALEKLKREKSVERKSEFSRPSGSPEAGFDALGPEALFSLCPEVLAERRESSARARPRGGRRSFPTIFPEGLDPSR